MTPRAPQLHLSLDLPTRYSRESFVTAPCNRRALQLLDSPAWPAGKMLLTGPAGSGKTHLLHIWAQESAAAVLDARELATLELRRLAPMPALAIDNAERVAGDAMAERALLHLHNILSAEGGRMLLTARAPSRDWGIQLADLASRLQATAHVALDLPDDTLLAAVLHKLFADRQVSISRQVIPYLVRHMERSLAAARELVARLDAASIAQRRRISVQLARDVLAQMPQPQGNSAS